jgi:predicted RecA/RadA family phage recombinase
MADIDFRCLNPDAALKVRFTNNSGGALEEGDMVYLNSGTMTKIADTLTTGVLGVLCADVADDDQVDVYVTGLFEASVEGTVDFDQGSAVYAAGASTVDGGSTSDVAMGYAANSDTASGATSIKFFLKSVLFDATTHA